MIAQELAINYPDKINKLYWAVPLQKRTGRYIQELPKMLGYEGNYSYNDLLSVPPEIS